MRVRNHTIDDTPIDIRDRDGFTAERLRQAQRVGNAIAVLFAELQAAPAFDVQRNPRRVQAI